MKFGFIGFGHLGRALADGLIMSGSAGKGDFFVCETSPDARSAAQNGPYHAFTSESANDILTRADVIILVVKGHIFREISKSIDRSALKGKTVVSFMAGETFEKIFSLIGDVDLVRAMPSLQIAVCDGVIGYTKAPPTIAEIFGKLGFAFETEPENIEKVMAFASCGLGFTAYLADAFATAGEAMGFPFETAAQHIWLMRLQQPARRWVSRLRPPRTYRRSLSNMPATGAISAGLSKQSQRQAGRLNRASYIWTIAMSMISWRRRYARHMNG